MRRQIKAYHRANISHCRTKLSLAIRTPFICKNFQRGRTQRQRARGCPQYSATPLVQLCTHARSRLANKSAMKSLQYTYLSAKIKSFAPQTAPIHYILPQNSHMPCAPRRIARTPHRIARAFYPPRTFLLLHADIMLDICIAACTPDPIPIPQKKTNKPQSSPVRMTCHEPFELTQFRKQKTIQHTHIIPGRATMRALSATNGQNQDQFAEQILQKHSKTRVADYVYAL